MAEIFQHISNHPDNPQKVFNIAGKTQEEAMKYLRYLHRNALFGTHTGLPKSVRNSKINESLVSNIGDYSVIDVYAYPQTKCIIGTVVNFHISDDVNPLGSTYVYPCTDRNKPMGYMISDATSEELGVCLVHGVLEVPLYYFSGSTEEKKDFVEYDIENACFKFSDSGYPVFNVYQDVDGDWIAIILFGDVSSDYEYDGPFAVSVAGVTGSTMYVNVLEGDIVDKHYRYTCSGIDYYDEDLTDNICLNTGETLWLCVYGTTVSGTNISTGEGSTNYFDNINGGNGNSSAVDYGSILSGNEGEEGEGGEGSNIDLTMNVAGSTYSYFVSSGTPIDLTGTTSFYRIAENVGGKLRQLQYGDIVIDETKDNHIPPYHALGVSGASPDGLGHTFILPVKGGTVGFWDEGGGAVGVWTNNDGTSTHVLVNKIPYTATEDGWIRISVIDGGTSCGECLSFFSATGGVPLYKYCAVSGGTGGSGGGGGGGGIGFPDYSLLGGGTISISGTTGYTGVGVTYLIPVPGGVSIEYETEAPECIDVARFASFLDSANSVSHDLVIDTPWQTPSDGGWVRISVLDNGLHRRGCLRFFVDGVDWSNALPLYRYGEFSSGYLTSFVLGGTATIGIYGTTNTVTFTAGENTTITKGEDGEIVIGATFTSPPPPPPSYQGLYTETHNSKVYICITDNTDSVPILGGTGCYVERGSDGAIIIGSTITPGDKSYDIIEGTGIDITVATTSANGVAIPTGDKIISVSTAFTTTFGENEASVTFAGSTNSLILKAGSNVQIARGGDNIVTISSTGSTGSTTQGLYTDLVSGTPALKLTESSDYVKFVGESDIYTNRGSDGEIVIGSTYTLPSSVYQDLSPSVSGTTATIGITNGEGFSLIPEGNSYIHSGRDGLVIGSTFTQVYQDLTSSVSESNGTATIGLTGSANSVVIKQGSNVSITEGQNGEVVLGATVGGSQDISASVSGQTVFIGLTGSDSVVKLVGTGSVEVSGNTKGEIVISDESIIPSLDLQTEVTGNTAYINISGSTNDAIRITGSTNVILEEVGSDNKEISLDISIHGLTHSILGGNTASVFLIDGGNPVKFVGTGSVEVSGNAKGEIVISESTGGGGGSGGGGNFAGYTTQIEASDQTVPENATEYIDAAVNTHYVFSFDDFMTVGSYGHYYTCYWNDDGKFKTPFGADSGAIYNYYSSGQGYGRELKLPSPDTGGVVEIDTFLSNGNIIISSDSTICDEDGTTDGAWEEYGFVYLTGSSRVLFIAHSSEHSWYMKTT